MPVFDTLFAGCCTYQFSAQVAFQGSAYRPGSTGRGLDAELLKELDGAAAHTTAEHHISFLLIYKLGTCPGWWPL